MKKNVFMYCCCSNGKEIEDRRANVLIKIIPLLLAEKNKIFSFKDSKFRLEKSKESTARIVLFKELGILNSYTLESSFYGPQHKAWLENRDPEENEPAGDAHLESHHLESLGADLCKICLVFCNPVLFRKKIHEIFNKFRKDVQPFHFNNRKNRRESKTPNLGTNEEEEDINKDLGSENEETNDEIGEFRIEEALKTIGNDESLMNIEQLWKIDEVSSAGSDSNPSDTEDPKFENSLDFKPKRKKNLKRTARPSIKISQSNSVPPKHKQLHIPKIERFAPLRPVSILEKKPVQDVLEDHLDNIYNLCKV